jgi:hypothetical protein
MTNLRQIAAELLWGTWAPIDPADEKRYPGSVQQWVDTGDAGAGFGTAELVVRALERGREFGFVEAKARLAQTEAEVVELSDMLDRELVSWYTKRDGHFDKLTLTERVRALVEVYSDGQGET